MTLLSLARCPVARSASPAAAPARSARGAGQFEREFGRLARDVGTLLAQAPTRRLLLLLALPCASFALTTCSAASGRTSRFARCGRLGVGLGRARAFAADLARRRVILKYSGSAVFYLLTGAGWRGRNAGHTAAAAHARDLRFSRSSRRTCPDVGLHHRRTLIFRSIAPDQPVAATVRAADRGGIGADLYMQALDGRGCGQGGLTGRLPTRPLSLTACAYWRCRCWRWMRSGGLEAEVPTPR